MERQAGFNRYYAKGKYEAALGGLVLGIIFLGVAVLSSLMITFDFHDNFVSLEYWGYWMFIPGFIILLAAFGQINTNRSYQRAVKNAILERGKTGSHKLEDLSLEVGIKPSDVLKVLVDLRNKGLIRYRFNPSSGEILLGETLSYSPSQEFTPPPRTIKEPLPKGKAFCQYCGHSIDIGALFCESCGSKL
jgi:hypothetical protein